MVDSAREIVGGMHSEFSALITNKQTNTNIFLGSYNPDDGDGTNTFC